MNTCKYCQALLPTTMKSCWRCGRATNAPAQPANMGNVPAAPFASQDSATFLQPQPFPFPDSNATQPIPPGFTDLDQPFSDHTVPTLPSASDQYPQGPHAPHHQPQTLHGSHHQPHGYGEQHGLHHQPQAIHSPHHQPQPLHGAHQQALQVHGSHHQPQQVHGMHQQPHFQHAKHLKGSGQGCRPSCLVTLISASVVVVIATVAVLVAFMSNGPTVVSGNLTVVGNAIPGQSVTVHGSNFSPGSKLIITLDQQPLKTATASTSLAAPALTDLAALLTTPSSVSGTPMTADTSGSFVVTVYIDPHWSAGSTHTLRIYDQKGNFIKGIDLKVVAASPTPVPTKTQQDCLTASPLSLAFTSSAGQTNPGPQQVTLHNCGQATGNWQAQPTTHDGANWLTVSPTSGSLNAEADQTVSIGITTTNLAAGDYSGQVTFSLGTASATVAVTLHVAPASPPCLTLSTNQLSFTTTAGGKDPAPQNLTVSNGKGCGAGTWSASSDAPWLSTNRTNGQIDANGTVTVSIAVANANLAVGQQNGHITVKAGTSTTTVTVTVTVQLAPPCLSVNPSTLDYTSTEGGADPTAQSVTLANGATCSGATWSVTSDAQWLTTDSKGGQIDSGGSTVVTIAASSASLSAGSYTGHITFSAGSSTTMVTVTLKVQSVPCISTRSLRLTFRGNVGSNATDPAPQRVFISNCGSAGTVTATVTMDTGSGWLSVSGGGQLDANGSIIFVVSAACIGPKLPASQTPYTGTVSFTITAADGGSKTITTSVSFTVVDIIG